MSKLEKGYGSGGMQAILGDVKTYYEGELAKKANTSDLGTAASRNATNQITEGSTALPEAGAVKSYVDTSISGKADKVTNATSGHLAGLDSNGNLTDSGVSPTEDMTVEGNPVTFDSPFEQDAKSVVVSVKPIQDLHGYDHPWPAGGGKNIVDAYADDTTKGYISGAYLKADNSFDSNEGWFVSEYFPVTAGATIVVSGTNGNLPSICFYDENKTYISGQSYEQALPKAFTVPANAVYFRASCVQLNKGSFQIEYGSTATSWEPYSNECPIVGIDEVEIGVSGKNILPKMPVGTTTKSGITYTVYSDGSINVNNTSSGYSDISLDVTDALKNFEGQTVFFSGNPASNNNTNIRQAMLINGSAYFDYNAGVEIALPDKIATALYLVAVAGTGTVASNVLFKPQIELGTEASDYEPYNPNSHTTTIPLPSTLYGGTVDVTEGDADSRSGIVDENGFSFAGAGTSGGGLHWADYFTDDVLITDSLCSVLPFFMNAWGSTTPCYTITENARIRVYGTFTSQEEFKTQYSDLQIAYKKSTPTTISFTPADVELLEGTNVVTTNAEKVAVTYKAGILATLGDIDDLNDKVKTKFDKANVATIETGSTASKTYYKGDYIVRSDGCLYDVTATIASGAAFTNSNTHKTNLGDELNKFKVYVSTADSPVDGNDVASVSMPGYLPISPFQVFSWSGSGTVSITPKSSGGTWNVSGDVSNVRYGQIFMRT